MSDYAVQRIPAAGFASNTWLVYDRHSREAAIIDPSAALSDILAELKRQALTLRWILLTHGHFDHIFSLDLLRDVLHIPAVIHPSDAPFLSDPIGNVSLLLIRENQRYRPPEKTVTEGDMLALGDGEIRVLHTPGHTEGSVCYQVGSSLFTGDTLMDETIGRTDLPSGDDSAMRASLTRLSALPGNTVIYPGHGPAATISKQNQYNPYL